MKKKILIIVIVLIVLIILALLIHFKSYNSPTFNDYTNHTESYENNILDPTFDRSIIENEATKYRDVKVDIINEVTSINNFHQFEVIYEDGSVITITWNSGEISIVEFSNTDLGLDVSE